MNKSIFQIWKKSIGGQFISSLISALILTIIIKYNINLSCIPPKNCSEFSFYTLKYLTHNNVSAMVNNVISDIVAKNTVDLLLEKKVNNNFKFSLSKYFINKNNTLLPFNSKNNHSHLNLYLGTYNNCFANFQFSHIKFNNSFIEFTEKDLTNNKLPQFICNILYLYSNELSQLMLNYNDLHQNIQYENLNSSLIIENTKNSVEYQNYLNKNLPELEKHVYNNL